MKRIPLLILLLSSAVFGLSFVISGDDEVKPRLHAESSVGKILQQLGEKAPDHWIQNPTEEQIKQGKELVFVGRTTGPDGKKTKQQSRFFVCTDCHNQVQEDPDLTKSDPEARLAYSIEKEIPFLQGTTFKGIVNRETWYNDDYLKKYGSLVAKARNDLRESIQICSINCSSGREMEDWEIEAVLAYFWSLEWKIGDLNLSAEDKKTIGSAMTGGNKEEALKVLKGYYMQASPANFDEGPQNREEGYGLKGDANRGSQVYNQSCLACHSKEGPSNYLKLDNSKQSKKFFRSRMKGWNRMNMYQIIRHGTYATEGHKAYMPHYPLERMSNQQVEDLRAYLESD